MSALSVVVLSREEVAQPVRAGADRAAYPTSHLLIVPTGVCS